ncbi:hypothetical protein OH687_26190 [Burkholderia anthina]|nr:hypothetical protein OH687_26190 [Burkholderia anthina]
MTRTLACAAHRSAVDARGRSSRCRCGSHSHAARMTRYVL